MQKIKKFAFLAMMVAFGLNMVGCKIGGVTVDLEAPGEVRDIEVSVTDGTATITWRNPTDNDFKEASYKITPSDGLVGATGATSEGTCTVIGIKAETKYTVTFHSYDQTGNESSGTDKIFTWNGTNGSVTTDGTDNTGNNTDATNTDNTGTEGTTSDTTKSESESKSETTKSYCEITTKAVDEGIKVTIKMLENVYFKDNCVTENTTGLTWSYGSKDSDLFTDGIYSFVFPFTESSKDYSFKIAGNVVDKTSGTVLTWYDETLSTCTATTTTDAGRWYANNMDYFTDYNVDCGYNAETQKFEVYRLFKQLDGITDADAQKAKVKNIMKSVINAKPDSVAKVSAYFYTVFGDVNWDNSTKWVGDGEKELSYDESTTYEQKETVSIGDWYISSGSDYSASVKKLCEQPFNGRYGTHHNYKIYLTSEETWSTSSYHSLQKYYYVEKTGTGTKYATKAVTRVLHAVYDKDLSQWQANSRYLVKDDETKDVDANTTLKELAKSYDGYEAETLIQTDNYLAVLYKAVETTTTN